MTFIVCLIIIKHKIVLKYMFVEKFSDESEVFIVILHPHVKL